MKLTRRPVTKTVYSIFTSFDVKNDENDSSTRVEINAVRDHIKYVPLVWILLKIKLEKNKIVKSVMP